VTGSSERREFLDQRREIARERYDRVHAARYDEDWGAIMPTHRAFVGRVLEMAAPGGLVVDVACGTGKYWPLVLASGRRVLGVDQSAGMLEVAGRKHPEVPTRVVGMQELAAQTDLAGAADAVLCVDAMENVGPEDWPPVLGGLHRLLRPGAPAYLTVELPEEALPDPVDPRQMPGELVGAGYHYYPSRQQVRGWLADAGFAVADEGDGDYYWHLILTDAAG
jgi:SAM-dependent methyltransferase